MVNFSKSFLAQIAALHGDSDALSDAHEAAKAFLHSDLLGHKSEPQFMDE